LVVDDLAIEVHWTFAEDPHRVDAMHVHLEWPSLSQNRYAAAQRVAEMCTIHATLSHPPTISIDVTEPSSSARESIEGHAHAHSESTL
jgi:uncharacterized OsmC-like protein